MTTRIDDLDRELRTAFAELADATTIDRRVPAVLRDSSARRRRRPPRGPWLAAAAAVALTVGGLVAIRTARTDDPMPVAESPGHGSDNLAPVFPALGDDGLPDPSFLDPSEAAAAYLDEVARRAPTGTVATMAPGTTNIAASGVDATTSFVMTVGPTGGEVTDRGDGVVTLGRASDGSWYVTGAGIRSFRVDQTTFLADTVTGVVRPAIGGEYEVTIEGWWRVRRADRPTLLHVVPTIVPSGGAGSFTASDVEGDVATILVWQTPGADVSQPVAMFANYVVRRGTGPISVDFWTTVFDESDLLD